MRKFTIVLALACTATATSALADEFTLQLPAASVEIFAQGALVTRSATLDLPAGSHRITIPMHKEYELDVAAPALLSTGSVITSIVQADRILLDPDTVLTSAQSAARTRLRAAKEQVAAKATDIANARARLAALEAQQSFLGSVRVGGLTDLTPQALLELSQTIRDETTVAAQSEVSLAEDITKLEEDLTDLQATLAMAERGFANLNPPQADGTGFLVSVNVPQSGPVSFELLEYSDAASWQMSYDIRLTEGPDPLVKIARNVLIAKTYGESWNDVDLIVSTAQLDTLTPSRVYSNRLSIEEIDPSLSKYASDGIVEPYIEPEVIIEEAAASLSAPRIDGSVVAYAAPTRVTIRPWEIYSLELSGLALPAEMSLRTSPRRDDTAFIVASVDNTSEDMILPGHAVFYRGDRLVGQDRISLQRIGEAADFAFGPEFGVQVSYDVLRRETGDRGLMSVTNTGEQTHEITLQNLTDTAKTVIATLALPYSEQEDLVINTTAKPNPDDVDVDSQRGVSAWTVDLPAGAVRTIKLSHDLSWPEGYDLRGSP